MIPAGEAATRGSRAFLLSAMDVVSAILTVSLAILWMDAIQLQEGSGNIFTGLLCSSGLAGFAIGGRWVAGIIQRTGYARMLLAVLELLLLFYSLNLTGMLRILPALSGSTLAAMIACSALFFVASLALGIRNAFCREASRYSALAGYAGGAAVAFFATGYVLIPAFGLSAALVLAATANAIFAPALYFFASRGEFPKQTPEDSDLFPQKSFPAFLCTFLLSCLLILWCRVFRFVPGISGLSVALVLGISLAGFSAGLSRRSHSGVATELRFLLLLAGYLTLLFPVYVRVLPVSRFLVSLFSTELTAFWIYQVVIGFFVSAVAFFPSYALGRSSGSVGLRLSTSVLGAISALIASHFLLFLGFQEIAVLWLVSIFTAGYVFVRSTGKWRRLVPLAFLAILIYHSFRLDWQAQPGAGLVQDLPEDALLAHIPMLLGSSSPRVLLEGFGATASVKQSLDGHRPASIAMPGAWKRDNTDLRLFLELTEDTYDAVLLRSLPAGNAGAERFWTTEFYQLVAKKLSKQGILAQSFEREGLTDATFTAILKDMRYSFPFVRVFLSPSRVIAVATLQPLAPDFHRMEQSLAVQPVRQELSRLHISNLQALLFLEIFSPDASTTLATFSGAMPDENFGLGFRAAFSSFQRKKWETLLHLDERLIASPGLLWREHINQGSTSFPGPEILKIAADSELPSLLYACRVIESNRMQNSNLLPASFRVQPALSDVELAERITNLLPQKITLARSVLRSYDTAIFLQSALSPAKAEFWLEQSSNWRRLSDDPLFVKTQLEIHIAAGKKQEAARLLEEWMKSSRRPAPQWAILRASQIDATHLRSRVLEFYSTLNQ